MSKLLKLKEWVTLDDAAKHLSIAFGENVAKADVLRLALDRRLTLSVNMLNGASARCGQLVPKAKAKWTEMPSLDGLRTLRVPEGVELTDGSVIELEGDIVSLRGIYDLSMIGNERLEVEHAYQMLTDGPAVTLHGLDGAFVIAGDGSYCQLQESFEENEFQSGSLAQGRKLEAHIESEGLDAETAQEMRNKYKADRELFKKRRADSAAKDNYYPAGGLPTDSVLVVRSDSLLDLQTAASSTVARDRRDAELGTRERDTLLKLVIGMAIEGYRYSPGAARNDAPAEIASDLAKHGMSMTDDTVRKWLKEAANKMLPQS
jgi:hypothetical protein